MEIDKIGLIFIRNKKLLTVLVKEKNTIPGGKREGNESDVETLIREIKEEFSVNLIPSTIKYFGTYYSQAHNQPKGTKIKLTCYKADFKGQLKPSKEIEKINWITSKTKNLSPAASIIMKDLMKRDLIV